MSDIGIVASCYQGEHNASYTDFFTLSRLTLAGIVVAFLVGLPSLVNLVREKSEICGKSQDKFCETLKTSPLSPAKPITGKQAEASKKPEDLETLPKPPTLQ